MSAVFTIVCNTCEKRGPQIHRKPGGVEVIGDKGEPSGAFLIEHEWCDLRLVHE
jgi:hypothetical protein